MKRRTKNILALTCIAVVCAIAVPAIIGEYTSDDLLSVNTITQTTTMGSNATYLITVNNIGNGTDTFVLTAINSDNASLASLSQSVITLDAGQSGTVMLNVTDDHIVGPYCVLVNVTSRNTGLCAELETITAVVESWEE